MRDLVDAIALRAISERSLGSNPSGRTLFFFRLFVKSPKKKSRLSNKEMNIIQLLCCALLTKATTYSKELLPTSRRLQMANPNHALTAVIDELSATGSSLCVCDSVDTMAQPDRRSLRLKSQKKAPSNM